MSLSRMNCGAFALVLFSLLHLETKSHFSEVVLDGQCFSFVCLNLSNKMQINLYKSNGFFLKKIFIFIAYCRTVTEKTLQPYDGSYILT